MTNDMCVEFINSLTIGARASEELNILHKDDNIYMFLEICKLGISVVGTRNIEGNYMTDTELVSWKTIRQANYNHPLLDSIERIKNNLMQAEVPHA